MTCSLRPEALRIARDDAREDERGNCLSGKRVQSVYLGEVAQHLIELPGGATVLALEVNPRPFSDTSERIDLTIDPSDVVVLSS